MNRFECRGFSVPMTIFFLLFLHSPNCLADTGGPEMNRGHANDSGLIPQDSNGTALKGAWKTERSVAGSAETKDASAESARMDRQGRSDGEIIGIVISVACLATLILNLMIFASLNN